MCGLCGIVNFNQERVEERELRPMMDRIRHRGPDDEGTFTLENLGIGFVRLSILDLSPAGHQPMMSRDGRFVLAFNGEIYNYIELREELKSKGYVFSTGTDTEVLLAAWQEWGEACQYRFNGMWAFVIYDKEEKTLFASRDRYGIKPFYYTTLDGRFLFASEIPALLSVLKQKPKPDNGSIYDYLVHSRVDHTEKTFFDGIVKLQHGHSLQIDLTNKTEPTIKRWYNLRERAEETEPFEDPEEFRDLFESAVMLRMRSDVPVGVCLSGGLDSSAIVSVLLSSGNHNSLNTFSAVYGEGKQGDEMEFIKEYEGQLKNMHFTRPTGEEFLADMEELIRLHAEPFPTSSIYAQYRVMKLAKPYVTVLLDGQGADELLAGYHYFFGYYFKDLIRSGRPIKAGSEMVHYLRQHRSLMGLKALGFFMMPDWYRSSLKRNENSYIASEYLKKHDGYLSDDLYGSPTLYDALLNHIEYKLEHLLKWEDRNSMHHSLEGRVPFLDYRLVEKALALKGRNVIHRGTTKHIFREAMNGVLPEKIRTRQDKIGFATPQDEWFRERILQDKINGVFSRLSRNNNPYVDEKKVLSLCKSHFDGSKNSSKQIWKFLNIELWLKNHIKI